MADIVTQNAATVLGDLLELRDSWHDLHRRLSRMTLDDESQEACAVLVKYLGSGNVPVWEDDK